LACARKRDHPVRTGPAGRPSRLRRPNRRRDRFLTNLEYLMGEAVGQRRSAESMDGASVRDTVGDDRYRLHLTVRGQRQQDRKSRSTSSTFTGSSDGAAMLFDQVPGNREAQS
jgi:hypothetical protein